MVEHSPIELFAVPGARESDNAMALNITAQRCPLALAFPHAASEMTSSHHRGEHPRSSPAPASLLSQPFAQPSLPCAAPVQPSTATLTSERCPSSPATHSPINSKKYSSRVWNLQLPGCSHQRSPGSSVRRKHPRLGHRVRSARRVPCCPPASLRFTWCCRKYWTWQPVVAVPFHVRRAVDTELPCRNAQPSRHPQSSRGHI